MINPEALAAHLRALGDSPLTNGGFPVTACEPWPPAFLHGSPEADLTAYRAEVTGNLLAQLREKAEERGAVLIAITNAYKGTTLRGQGVLRRDGYAVPLATLPHVPTQKGGEVT